MFAVNIYASSYSSYGISHFPHAMRQLVRQGVFNVEILLSTGDFFHKL